MIGKPAKLRRSRKHGMAWDPASGMLQGKAGEGTGPGRLNPGWGHAAAQRLGVLPHKGFHWHREKKDGPGAIQSTLFSRFLTQDILGGLTKFKQRWNDSKIKTWAILCYVPSDFLALVWLLAYQSALLRCEKGNKGQKGCLVKKNLFV